jgi:hypothetical protein
MSYKKHLSDFATYRDLAAKSDDKFRVADDPNSGSSRLETDAAAGGGGDHRISFAASKAIHHRFILRSIPTTAALKWFVIEGGEV